MPKIPNPLLLLFGIASIQGCSQLSVVDSSAELKPSWVNEAPVGKSFVYYSGMGSSNTSLQHAQENAVSNVLQQLVDEGTVKVSVEASIEVSESFRASSGSTNYELTDDFFREVMRTGTSKSINGLRKEEEYWQSVNTGQGVEYQYWVLFKVPKAGMNPTSAIIQGYGLAPVWRSSILPGWGQRFKGEKSKGTKLLIGTATSGAATFVSFYMSDSYARKAANERDITNRKFYNGWSNRSYTIGIVSGLLTGTIYGYNIFDALTAPGAKKYASGLPAKDHDLLAYYDGSLTQITLKLYF